SYPTPYYGTAATRHTSRDPNAGPAGVRVPVGPRAGVHGHQGLCGFGSGADLHTGVGLVPTSRWNTPALPDVVGFISVLSYPRGITKGTGIGRTTCAPRPARSGTNTPPRGL